MVAAVMPDGTVPKFDNTKQEAAFLEDANNFILCLDCEEEKEFITDMRKFNIWGNTGVSIFDSFWDSCACTLDLENGYGAHNQRHEAGDGETTMNILYAPGILSIPQPIRATVKHLEKDGKVK